MLPLVIVNGDYNVGEDNNYVVCGPGHSVQYIDRSALCIQYCLQMDEIIDCMSHSVDDWGIYSTSLSTLPHTLSGGLVVYSKVTAFYYCNELI